MNTMKSLGYLLTAGVFSVGSVTLGAPKEVSLFPESIYLSDGRQPIEALAGSQVYEWGRSIVAIHNIKDADNFCTGSLVAPNVIMTNQHCAAPCTNTGAQFYYEGQGPGAEVFRCTRTLGMNVAFDYWFFEIEGTPTGVQPLSFATTPAKSNDRLLMIGHPWGGLKKVDNSDECRVWNANGGNVYQRFQNLLHQCDTEPGNSGSPVLRARDGRIIALHWGGGASTTNASSGNHAIHAHAVLTDIATKIPDLHAILDIRR